MSIVQTRYFVVVCDWCDAYVKPGAITRPRSQGVMLADPPAATSEARNAGWRRIRAVAETGPEPFCWLDLCPDCLAAAEREVRAS